MASTGHRNGPAVRDSVVMRPADADTPELVALCALAAAWMLWMFTLHPTWRERRQPAMASIRDGRVKADRHAGAGRSGRLAPCWSKRWP